MTGFCQSRENSTLGLERVSPQQFPGFSHILTHTTEVTLTLLDMIIVILKYFFIFFLNAIYKSLALIGIRI